MSKVLVVLALAVGTFVLNPSRAKAQCNERCVSVVTTDGAKGFGCVVDNDSGAACIARSTACYTKLCYNAMVTDPSGRVLAVADVCNDEVTLRPVARTHAVGFMARDRAAKRGGLSSMPAAKARAG